MYCTQCGVNFEPMTGSARVAGNGTGVGRMETSARPLMLDKRNKKMAESVPASRGTWKWT